MSHYENIKSDLKINPKKWLITGCAGFIGSNLLESLLKLDQFVVGLDNFATGYQKNLDQVAEAVTAEQWSRFKLIEGDIRNSEKCKTAVEGIDYVLHQAALGSVPRSINDPQTTNSVNIDGFLNMLLASKDEKVSAFVYAASSSTYGDHKDLPKIEERIGKPLSPYAVTKYVNELYADVFSKCYGMKSVGLRYFNVFGRRQDPNGPYAAVIPKWISSMIADDDIYINGDGTTSRDFCYVENVVQANILAATVKGQSRDGVYNVALGDITSLNELFDYIKSTLKNFNINYGRQPIYRDFREGDVRHSQADISKAKNLLSYTPEYRLKQGLESAMGWYVLNGKRESSLA